MATSVRTLLQERRFGGNTVPDLIVEFPDAMEYYELANSGELDPIAPVFIESDSPEAVDPPKEPEPDPRTEQGVEWKGPEAPGCPECWKPILSGNTVFTLRDGQVRHLACCHSHIASQKLVYEKAPRLGRSSRRPKDYTFFGTNSFEEAYKLAIYGWAEGAANIKKASDALIERIMSKVPEPQPRWDVVGQAVDVGRYLMGEPECMIDYHDEVVEKHDDRIVQISMAGSASWLVDKLAMYRKGAALCSLADALEKAGRRVEITLIIDIDGGGRDCHMVIPCKLAEEPVDMMRLSYLIAHASAFRRLGFSIMEQLPWEYRKVCGIWASVTAKGEEISGGGYGRPCDTPEELQCPIHISNKGMGVWSDDDRTEEWVLQQLKQAGVDITLDEDGDTV